MTIFWDSLFRNLFCFISAISQGISLEQFWDVDLVTFEHSDIGAHTHSVHRVHMAACSLICLILPF